MRYTLASIAVLGFCSAAVLPAVAAEKTPDNPNGCQIIQGEASPAPGNGVSSNVTAGGGAVSSSSSAGGVTVQSNGNGTGVAMSGSSGDGSHTMVWSGDGNCTIYVTPGKKDQ